MGARGWKWLSLEKLSYYFRRLGVEIGHDSRVHAKQARDSAKRKGRKRDLNENGKVITGI